MRKYSGLARNFRQYYNYASRADVRREISRHVFVSGVVSGQRLSLDSLDEEQVGQLLHIHNFTALRPIFKKEGLNGMYETNVYVGYSSQFHCVLSLQVWC